MRYSRVLLVKYGAQSAPLAPLVRGAGSPKARLRGSHPNGCLSLRHGLRRATSLVRGRQEGRTKLSALVFYFRFNIFPQSSSITTKLTNMSPAPI